MWYLELLRLDVIARVGSAGSSVTSSSPPVFSKVAPELVDRVLQRDHGVVAQVAGLPDRVEDAGVVALQLVEELVLEPADVLDRHVVEVALGTSPDRDHLPLDRERAVLRLLEQLDQPGAAVKLGAGRGVEVGGERGERLQVAVLRQRRASARRRPSSWP